MLSLVSRRLQGSSHLLAPSTVMLFHHTTTTSGGTQNTTTPDGHPRCTDRRRCPSSDFRNAPREEFRRDYHQSRAPHPHPVGRSQGRPNEARTLPTAPRGPSHLTHPPCDEDHIREDHASHPPRFSHQWRPSGKEQRRLEAKKTATLLDEKFEALDEFDVEPQAAELVGKYLRRSGQQVEPSSTQDPSGHVARLKFSVGNIEVVALGHCAGKKQAVTLCYMHAQRLIEYYGKEGAVAENAPAPLRLTRVQPGSGATEAKPMRPRRPQFVVKLEADATADERADALQSWGAYCANCEEYVNRCAILDRKSLMMRLLAPPCGDPLADASAVVAQFQSVNYSAVSRWQALCQQGGYATNPEEWLVSTIGPGAKACTFPLPQFTWLEAVGLGRTKQDARVRAAMHAIHMLETAEKEFGSLSKRASSRFQPRDTNSSSFLPGGGATSLQRRLGVEETPNSVRGGIPATAVVRARHTDEIKSRLIELYTICLDLPVPVAEAESDRTTGMWSSRVKVGDYSCHGRGLNKEDAERHAYHALYEELTMNEPLFREIATLLETHPHLDPEHIVKLQLDSRLAADIENLVSDADFSADEETVNAYIDQPTQRLLGRLSTSDDVGAALLKRQEALHQDPVFLTDFLPKKQRLAMLAHRDALLRLVAANRVTIICGTTGCGKTTQVPQFLLEDAIAKGHGGECSILVTQPRRISALSIAERIAAERREKVGETVGYTIRLESRPGSNINLCTTGVLLQMFLGSPDLKGLKYLIIDEIHERDLNCDFALIMVKELLQRNKDVKLILMSATLQSELFSAYFDHAPVLHVEGQTFPVAEYYLDAIAEIAKQRRAVSFMTHSAAEMEHIGTFEARRQQKLALKPRAKDFDYNLLSILMAHVVKAHDLVGKSVLVFLPGWKEITAARKALERDDRYHFIFLHSTVDSKEQLKCFQPAPDGKYKIILSTNIAESGVTIDDVAVVIDAGTIKEMSWILRSGTTNVGRDSLHGLNQLVTAYASQANCIQRRGRAGRTQGGACYRFFTFEDFQRRPAFQTPEMLRQPLDAVILRMLAMGYTDPALLLRNAIEPPSPKFVAASLASLQALGAVDQRTKLTSLGRWLSKLPTTPRTGKMIMLGTVLKCLDSVLTLAAASEMGPFVTARDYRKEVRQHRFDFAEHSSSDHIANINAFNGFAASGASTSYCSLNMLNFGALNLMSKYKRQFYEILVGSGFLDRSFLVDTELRRGIRDARGHPIPFLDVSEYSRDAQNVGLVKSVICAGLFPNVALQNTLRQNTKEKVLRTKLHNHLVFGKDSVAYRAKGEETSLCPYYVYDEMMLIADTNTEFMAGVTAANMWAILLLGASSSHVSYRDDLQIGIIDDWIIFQSSADTVENILKLKRLIHHCILVKFKTPDDAANNDKLDRIQRICKELFNRPLKPNDFAAEWKQAGAIVAPMAPVASPLASNAAILGSYFGDDLSSQQLQPPSPRFPTAVSGKAASIAPSAAPAAAVVGHRTPAETVVAVRRRTTTTTRYHDEDDDDAIDTVEDDGPSE